MVRVSKIMVAIALTAVIFVPCVAFIIMAVLMEDANDE